MKSQLDEELIIRYLLHQLSQQETMEVEEVYKSDENCFERICAIEDALIDDYLSGALPTLRRVEFEKAYSASARAERVEFARQLRESLKLHRKKEIPLQFETTPDEKSPGGLISFTLAPGLLRGEEDDGQTLVIAGDTTGILLGLELNVAEEYGAYQAVLKNARGGIVETTDGLQSIAGDSGPRTLWQLPVLKPGEYQLTLNGKAADGGTEYVDTYYLRVAKSE